MVAFTIHGEPASKANSRQSVINPVTGKRMFIKSQKALKYVEDVKKQVRRLDPLLKGPLVVHITIYYRTERPDLDESLILDALQGIIYKNDRQIRTKHIYRGHRHETGLAHVRIEAMEQMGRKAA